MHRLVDANLNRAREASRVVEEIVRFVLNEASLTRRLRSLRHAIAALGRGQEAVLLSARDSERDVARAAPGFTRTTPHAIALANFKRLQEALRVLEECGHREAAPLRFQAYDLEKEAIPRLIRNRAFDRARLYVILSPPWIPANPVPLALRLYEAGVDILQLRIPSASDAELFRWANRIAREARKSHAYLIVNNRPDVARAAGAHGVHLGSKDLSIGAARDILLSDQIVGATTHTLAEARAAARAGADYISAGPLYPSQTKPGLPASGLSYLRRALRLGLPAVAIGGITEDRVERLVQAGVKCIAVSQAVLSDPDPPKAARRLKRRLKEAT